MKALIVIGTVLIVLGVLALISPNIPYTSQRDVIRVGPMQTTVETRRSIAVPPIVGGLVLAGGTALVALGLKKKF